AAMRMLMNNLDPNVAENPDQLVVYGGTGRAARSWEAFDAIVRSLRELENDETLLVQSGKPVGKFKTHDEAPRVLIANSNLVGQCADVLPEIVKRGIVPDVLTDQTSAHDALNGYVPHGISLKDALVLRRKNPDEYIERAMQSMAVHVEAMLALQKNGAVTFDY